MKKKFKVGDRIYYFNGFETGTATIEKINKGSIKTYTLKFEPKIGYNNGEFLFGSLEEVEKVKLDNEILEHEDAIGSTKIAIKDLEQRLLKEQNALKEMEEKLEELKKQKLIVKLAGI